MPSIWRYHIEQLSDEWDSANVCLFMSQMTRIHSEIQSLMNRLAEWSTFRFLRFFSIMAIHTWAIRSNNRPAKWPRIDIIQQKKRKRKTPPTKSVNDQTVAPTKRIWMYHLNGMRLFWLLACVYVFIFIAWDVLAQRKLLSLSLLI